MDFRSRSLACVAIAVAIAGSGCASREARDFSGAWTPLNQYATSSEAIPLQQAVVFQASPMDGTLRNLLMRWTRDSGTQLDYRHPSDFTLHQPVGHVHARSLADAVAQLGDAFGGQGVVMRMEGGRLVVAAGSDGGS